MLLLLISTHRSHLTQGKVDGAEGRTSYSGLHTTLQIMLQSLTTSLQSPLTISEEIFFGMKSSSGALPVDLIIGGIWKPVANALQTNFSGMFMTGITSIFHRAYSAVDTFLRNLSEICGPKWSSKIYERLLRHESVVSFQQQWKIELYVKVNLPRLLIRITYIHSFGRKR